MGVAHTEMPSVVSAWPLACGASLDLGYPLVSAVSSQNTQNETALGMGIRVQEESDTDVRVREESDTL